MHGERHWLETLPGARRIRHLGASCCGVIGGGRHRQAAQVAWSSDRLPARTRSCIAGPAQRRTAQVDAAHGHVAEWLRNGLQNRVLRFNSGRGLQLSKSTQKIASATHRRRALVDPTPKLATGASDAGQFKLSRQFWRARELPAGTRNPKTAPRPFCAMQQSIGAMRQLSVITMVYQHIWIGEERLQPHGCRLIET